MCELRNNAKVRTRYPLLVSPSAEGEKHDPPFRRREGRVGFHSFAFSHFRIISQCAHIIYALVPLRTRRRPR